MEPIKSLGDMNGYESSPSTSPENTTGAIEVEEHLCVFFVKVPKNITRNQAKGGLIDRQELDRVNEEVAFLSVWKGIVCPANLGARTAETTVDVLTLYTWHRLQEGQIVLSCLDWTC